LRIRDFFYRYRPNRHVLVQSSSSEKLPLHVPPGRHMMRRTLVTLGHS